MQLKGEGRRGSLSGVALGIKAFDVGGDVPGFAQIDLQRRHIVVTTFCDARHPALETDDIVANPDVSKCRRSGSAALITHPDRMAASARLARQITSPLDGGIGMNRTLAVS
jgi:hypothetical protein